ncbi:hypothetical protein V1511DRAFT_9219 [Dipodascopsis uninucleata]
MPHFEGDAKVRDASSSPPSEDQESPTKSNVVETEMDGDNLDNDLLEEAALLESVENSRRHEEAAQTEAKIAIVSDVSQELMIAFYERLFPFKDLFQWLNHFPSPTAAFTNREFAFTLQNDVYIRYNSFATHEAMKKEVLRLNPSRFEIGPVYTANPRDRRLVRKNAFKPLEKELVFDIDMTDYDDIRTCCSAATICEKCWKFITVAIRVLDIALREDFGFQHILWVYSGRRGAHAWVCDKRAREMDDIKRSAVASYFELLQGGANSTKRVNIKRPLHPFVSRSLNILKDMFPSTILSDQDPWRSNEDADKLLKLLPDKALNEELRKRWEGYNESSSTRKWSDIDDLARTGISKTLDPKQLREAKQDVILEYMYPRIDSEVSKHLNHLLKSPFCVHPGTGRVCVPIDISDLETFNPMKVPTVSDLINDIDKWNETDEAKYDYEKTSLKPYIEYFHKFVSGLTKDEMRAKRQREQEAGDSLDF